MNHETSPSVSGWKFTMRQLFFLAVVLVCLASLYVFRSVQEDEERMRETMKSQADVLIWAFEGGTRSMMLSRGNLTPSRQSLIEEVARQPNILYLAITDRFGTILAHSDPAEVGKTLHSARFLDSLTEARESVGAFVEDEGENVFEVAKEFTPSMRVVHSRHGMGTRQHMRQPPGEVREPGDQLPIYIFVGMDPALFTETLNRKTRATALAAFATVAAICGGLFLLSLMQRYRSSRQMLREERALTLQIFANVPIGIFTTDSLGNLTLYNKQAAVLLNRGKNMGLGQPVPGQADCDWKALMAEMDSIGPILERDMVMNGPQGRPHAVSLSASAIISDDGLRSGFLFILRDVEEMKKLREQVRRNERLSALGNMAAGVAHEIRNPLSTIKGYATYLAGKFSSTDPAGEIGRMLISEVERLNRVVSDLLGVSSVGRVKLVPCVLADPVQNAVRLAEAEAGTRKVRIELDTRFPSTTRVNLDPDKFVQALLNLLINAVQASPAGGEVQVETGIVQVSHPAGPGQVYVRVTDRGEGMGSETLGQLFTPYFTTKASGTGLGLTIAHQIIEQHGGTITVTSEPGRGSVFTIHLPGTDEAVQTSTTDDEA